VDYTLPLPPEELRNYPADGLVGCGNEHEVEAVGDPLRTRDRPAARDAVGQGFG
jgi:hypothetical protein